MVFARLFNTAACAGQAVQIFENMCRSFPQYSSIYFLVKSLHGRTGVWERHLQCEPMRRFAVPLCMLPPRLNSGQYKRDNHVRNSENE